MLDEYNILLLGPTQSGKSTFLEYARQYADPSHKIDEKFIGGGNESCTREPRVEVIETTLPIYKLYENGQEFDQSSLRDERAFRRLFARDDDLESRAVEVPDSPKVRFKIFDTPGLNDTQDNDIMNIARTFSYLSQIGHLHLIIIMDSHNVPLLQSQQDAFRAYFGLFEELKGLITIVHTHSPNKYRVPGLNPRHDTKLKERSQFFNEIARREVPTKRVDCDLDQTEPAHVCMTRNAIREILEMAKIKASVKINTTVVSKTQAMKSVDKIAHDTFKGKLEEALRSCQSETQKVIVAKENTEREINEKQEEINRHNTSELLDLDERRFDEEVNFFGWFADLFGRSNAEHVWEFNTEHDINEVTVGQFAIQVLEQSEWQGKKYWRVKFKRYAFNTGYYHAVLKTFKSTRYKQDIETWKQELESLNKSLKNHQDLLDRLNQIEQGAGGSQDDPSDSFGQLRKTITSYRSILDLTAGPTLPLAMFMELAKAGIYQGKNFIQSAKVLEEHLAKEFGV